MFVINGLERIQMGVPKSDSNYKMPATAAILIKTRLQQGYATSSSRLHFSRRARMADATFRKAIAFANGAIPDSKRYHKASSR
jgi:hypothetical protein